MNRCKEQKEKQLRDYFLNRLTPDEMNDFQYHLIHCEACRIALERMRYLTTETGDLDAQQKKQPEVNLSKNHYPMHLFTRVAAIAGLLFLLAGGGYYFLSISSSTREFPIEMNDVPVFHAIDSVAVDSITVDSITVDSINVRLKKREFLHEE